MLRDMALAFAMSTSSRYACPSHAATVSLFRKVLFSLRESTDALHYASLAGLTSSSAAAVHAVSDGTESVEILSLQAPRSMRRVARFMRDRNETAASRKRSLSSSRSARRRLDMGGSSGGGPASGRASA